MDKEKQVLELFNKYYEYVRTTDDGEQRGEWRRDFARQVVKLFCQPDVMQSLPLSELGDFVDWIRDIRFKMYGEGWCQEGGSNGWHCSTEELIKMFKERGNVA